MRARGGRERARERTKTEIRQESPARVQGSEENTVLWKVRFGAVEGAKSGYGKFSVSLFRALF